MCLCTQYDSHCGHSWVSLSTPCGYLRDFLNCFQRQIVQHCIAPPGTCPQCFAGFANPETIEMIQGPWGCNQLIRSHLGESHAIPGYWGKVNFQPQNRGNGPMMMLGGRGAQHVAQRLIGPLQPGPDVMTYNEFFHGGDAVFGDGRRRRRRTSDEFHYRKYKRKVSDGAGCLIM